MTNGTGLDVEATFGTYRALVERNAPATMPLAIRTWARLDPDRWPLEWHLPRWLGEAFCLDPAIVRSLVTSNVMGLAYIRLADDLVDGDLAESERADAATLAPVLYEAALEPYRRHFPAGTSFWHRLESWMAEWAGSGEDMELARRGAPLKISALATCELVGRPAAFPDLARCLDRAVTALVRYDHACDWRADLAAGRWNAFADAVGGGDVRTVEAAVLAGGAVGQWFARIDRELADATTLADALGIAGLAAHLRRLRTSFEAEGLALEGRYDALGAAATDWLFGQLAT